MSVLAYEHGHDRFVGLTSQWEAYCAANGIDPCRVPEKPTNDERARWRREGWFVTASIHERVSVRQRAGEFLETCGKDALLVRLTDNPGRIFLDRPGDAGQAVALFWPNDAELFALEILRQCKAARATDAKAVAEDAIDETQWERP